jgi:nitrous oxide reductase accessory protein NosL
LCVFAFVSTDQCVSSTSVSAPTYTVEDWFHTLAFDLFRYYFRHERREWEATAIYVTDYSALDYELDQRDRGMGPELLPFSAADDVRAFVENHGGRTVGFDDVTPQSISAYTSR